MISWKRSRPSLCTTKGALRRVVHGVCTTKGRSSTFMVADIDVSTRHGEPDLQIESFGVLRSLKRDCLTPF